MHELMQGRVHTIGRDHVVYTMDRANPPAIRVLPGALVLADRHACFGGFIRTSQDDVDLLRTEVGAQGSAPLYPGEFGFLKDDSIGAFTKIAPVENGVIRYRDDVRIPVQPMLGTLGVAAAGGPRVQPPQGRPRRQHEPEGRLRW